MLIQVLQEHNLTERSLRRRDVPWSTKSQTQYGNCSTKGNAPERPLHSGMHQKSSSKQLFLWFSDQLLSTRLHKPVHSKSCLAPGDLCLTPMLEKCKGAFTYTLSKFLLNFIFLQNSSVHFFLCHCSYLRFQACLQTGCCKREQLNYLSKGYVSSSCQSFDIAVCLG